jgi:uncharacterized protein (DUF2141 family)
MLATIATLAALLFAAPAPPAARPPSETDATLAFAVEGVKSTKGQLIVAVYTSKATWLDLSRAAKVLKITPRVGSVFAVLEGVPLGECAVAVFHDENGNGKLDMGWFPLPGPIEPSGASNGATSRLGPPGWEEAKFDCKVGEAVVKLKLVG